MDADRINMVFLELVEEIGEPYSNERRECWEDILMKTEYVPNDYMRSSLEYQKTYMECFTDYIIDLSLFIKDKDGLFIGVWPLSIKKKDNTWEFCTNQGPVLPPLFIRSVAEKEKRIIDQDCINLINEMYRRIVPSIQIKDTWMSRYLSLPILMNNNETIWWRLCCEGGCTAICETMLYMDLTKTKEELFHSLRKKYRQYINKGEREWKITVHDKVTDEMWSNYRRMHAEVSGRVTRSIESWDIEKESINNGNAFYVESTDKDGEFIGGGYFEFSKDECLSAVGVYDRSQFNLPVSHVINWRAICHMQELGLKQFVFGRRFWPGDNPRPTEKELQIAYFKEGFAKDYILKLILNNTMNT